MYRPRSLRTKADLRVCASESVYVVLIINKKVLIRQNNSAEAEGDAVEEVELEELEFKELEFEESVRFDSAAATNTRTLTHTHTHTIFHHRQCTNILPSLPALSARLLHPQVAR